MKFLIVLTALFATVVIASPTVAIPSSADASASTPSTIADESAAIKYLLTHPPAGHNVDEDGPAPAGCYWDGTAPFCAGACPPGYEERTRGGCGDGACCITGYKFLCCK